MSKKYSEAIAIGIAGDNINNVNIKVYYVFGSTDETYKLIENYTTSIVRTVFKNNRPRAARLYRILV
jgi:hypothetical protein